MHVSPKLKIVTARKVWRFETSPLKYIYISYEKNCVLRYLPKFSRAYLLIIIDRHINL